MKHKHVTKRGKPVDSKELIDWIEEVIHDEKVTDDERLGFIQRVISNNWESPFLTACLPCGGTGEDGSQQYPIPCVECWGRGRVDKHEPEVTEMDGVS
jgi:hypothetical protein